MRVGAFGALMGAICLASLSAARADGEAVEIEFFLGVPGAKHAPRFSAKPVTAKLSSVKARGLQGIEHLGGRIKIGPKPGKGRPFVLGRSREGMVYDLLVIDANGDGKLEDEMPARFELRQSGGKNHSMFEFVVRVNHDGKGEPERHPLSMSVSTTGNGDAPQVLSYSSAGYRSCRVILGGEGYFVVLSDAQSDGVYGEGDSWTIRPATTHEPYEIVHARTVGDYVWAGGKAWKLKLEGTRGKHARLVPFDPGITEEEDRRKRNPVAADPEDPEIETPLEFVYDIEAGRAEAQQEQAALFLSFEAAGCAQCQAMRGAVYGNTEIASAANGLVCVQLDAQKDPLVHEYGVKDHPTGILFDPDGDEIERFEGVQSVNEFLAFLSEAHSYLWPSDHEPAKLKGAAKKRHAKVVKALFRYLDDNKGHGLLVDRIADLGTRKNRAARDALIQFAEKRKSKEYVAAAFFAIAKISGKRSIEFLCGKKGLASGDFLVAQKAAEALGTAKDPRAIGPITSVMTSKGTKIEIVHACAIALAKCGPDDEAVTEVILEYTGHQKDTIRAGAVEALGYLKSERALARLKEFLKHDKNTRVRAHAAWGIGHTMRTELIPLLRDAIKDDKAHTVRTAALEAIREIQGEEKK